MNLKRSCKGSQTGCIGLFDASKPENFSATKVMKAINTNSARALRQAIAIAPRNKRATELLNITVGTQSISPFYWAIDSGSLECAKAMIEDLLTIRADRSMAIQ